MKFCTNWFENIVQPCRRVVPKYSVLNAGWTCLTKNSVLTDYLKVGLRVNSNGPHDEAAVGIFLINYLGNF